MPRFTITTFCGGCCDRRHAPSTRPLYAILEMTVDRVMAQIRFAADKPARERRSAVVEDFLEWPVPVDQLRLLHPERVGLLDRAAMELFVGRHLRPRCRMIVLRLFPRVE